MNGLPLIEWALNFAFIAVGTALVLAAWRLVRGPDAIDRVLALDTMYINVVALVILLGIRFGTALFFDAGLLIALLGFISTVALSRYLSRGDVIE
jgi:multicomponent K+:H+ antiporter subunit F